MDYLIVTIRPFLFKKGLKVLKSRNFIFHSKLKFWYGHTNFWEIEDYVYLHAEVNSPESIVNADLTNQVWKPENERYDEY